MQLLPYFLGFLTLVFFIWQFYPYFKLKSVRGQKAPSLNAILDTEQSKHQQVLLYFMSPHCGMCRNITPIVDEISKERTDIIRVDISKNPEIARDLGVMGTPAFVLVKEGVIEKVKLGGLSRDKILEMLI